MAVRIICADVMDGLRQLEDESVHCVVTSPPYWGLRDYGTGQWEGGDATCDHLAPLPGGFMASGMDDNPKTAADRVLRRQQQYRELCAKCGARRIDRQIGLEPTPDAFVARMVEVFREVKRVLRKDGTCWVNLGDSYAASLKGTGGDGTSSGLMRDGRSETGRASKLDAVARQQHNGLRVNLTASGLKAKDLMGMPWRVAFALQADGWWLRSDVIWAKPNPMPESVTDRPTKAHEYVFLLTKASAYYYDAEAVKEQQSEGTFARFGTDGVRTGSGSKQTGSPNGLIRDKATYSKAILEGGRNKRSVWTIATAPFPEAHFATFPPELPEICIKASTSEKGCCAKCGAPWERETEAAFTPSKKTRGKPGEGQFMQSGAGNKAGGWNDYPALDKHVKTLGWSPSCSCNADTVAATVLDPFCGAGTTCLVADRLQRNAVGIELNPTYAAMAESRLSKDRGGLLDWIEQPTEQPKKPEQLSLLEV